MKQNIFPCLLFFYLLTIPLVAMIFLPSDGFSAEENRMLASFPSADTDSLLDGSFAAGLEKYMADHFPLRNTLLKIKSASELIAGRKQNGNVMFGKNMYQIKRLESFDRDILQQNKDAVDNLSSHLSETNKACITLFAPRAIDVLTSKLPNGYPTQTSQGVWDILPRSPLTQTLSEKAERGEYVWFRTDHHWTSLGAYCAYQELGSSLGYTPLMPNAFHKETVKDDFFGTSAAASQFPIRKADSIFRYRYEGDESVTITDLSTGQTQNGFYRDDKLHGADAYASFLGGNFAHLSITKSGTENRPLLLVIKDSYANALIPFLAIHFDIEMLDTRYIRGVSWDMIDAITAKENYAGALLLWNAETLCSDAGLFPFITT